MKTFIDIEELKELYQSGGVVAVSEQYNCSKPTAYALLDKAGIPRIKRPQTGNRFVLTGGKDDEE